MTRLMSWPDGERYSCSLQSHVVTLFLYPLFSFLRLEAYCLIEILRRPCSLDFHRGTDAPSRLRCNGHSLSVSFYHSRIGRIENPSRSACGHFSFHSALSSYGLFAPLALCLSTSGELPGFWGSMVFRHAPILGKGNNNIKRWLES